jgi:hypothetical protein
MAVPLQNWPAQKRWVVQAALANGRDKAATDAATVYRPVTPCRLVDTRGGAPITLTSPFLGGAAPNGNVQTVTTAGNCGIPTSYVRGLSLSFHLYNYTTSNGGYIQFTNVGANAPIANAVFNVGALWTAATANVPTSLSGSFDVHVIQSNIDLIIDVNGYYQDLDQLDVGTQQLDISGSTTGDLFELANTATGSALSTGNYSTGPALRIYAGKVSAYNAGVGTTTFSFVHQVNTTAYGSGGTICGGFPAYSVLDHPMLNGDANAMIYVTPRRQASGAIPSGNIVTYYMPGSGCSPSTSGRWMIQDASGAALPNTAQFSVMIINN